MAELTESQRQRVQSAVVLFVVGLILITGAFLLRHWMLWATGALVIGLGMWMAED